METFRILQPITEAMKPTHVGTFSCPCIHYLTCYFCKHSLGLSIRLHTLPEEMCLDVPIGYKKGPGRPKKAVQGALNHQPKVVHFNVANIEELVMA